MIDPFPEEKGCNVKGGKQIRFVLERGNPKGVTVGLSISLAPPFCVEFLSATPMSTNWNPLVTSQRNTLFLCAC